MLLTVEGGGFFSSSASGYNKGLTLLLLGQKNEEKPMRVTPWNQYQLADQDTDPDLQLASEKNRTVRGCTSFVCFGGAAAGPESSSPLKVGSTHKQEVLPEPLDVDESKDQAHSVDPVVDDDDDDDNDDDDSHNKMFNLKSSLKKSVNSVPVADTAVDAGDWNSNKLEASCEKDNNVTCQMEKRKVQWTDTIGGELFEIREFEMSEGTSDDEFDLGNGKTCSCCIM